MSAHTHTRIYTRGDEIAEARSMMKHFRGYAKTLKGVCVLGRSRQFALGKMNYTKERRGFAELLYPEKTQA
jgi:hypothetical protein